MFQLCLLPDLVGCFIYGDYSTGKIWGIRHDGTQVTFHRELADTTLQITGFATNGAGDLLVIDHAGGASADDKQLHRIDENLVAKAAVRAGFVVEASWTDPAGDFLLTLAHPYC